MVKEGGTDSRVGRYRAEILCILFNTEHFRGVLYGQHFSLYDFMVCLVLKLEEEDKKAETQLTYPTESGSMGLLYQGKL